ncbi:hypothetical protein CTA2_12124 [Colletotrichum tanaceti]|uniref:Uncharacterized protein n=1 Tax=Colletotrichum tanaceti TaxID=1306861 RepID=A0A4V6DH37_9PEZI|nr:hypothetical protein CTA2_12124 [Colletotrichum tanaceti]TKW55196.1 hypothetical protein CTA1_1239 [Colletotrichum tanaceti]
MVSPSLLFLLLPGTALMKAQCAADNCLRALNATQTPGRIASAQAFGATFTQLPTAAAKNTSIPGYASEHCGGALGSELSSRLSSACSCIAPSSASGSVATSTTVYATVTPTPKYPCHNSTSTRLGSGTWTGIRTGTGTGTFITVNPIRAWRQSSPMLHACLKSVPLHKEVAIALVDAIRPYLEWQSTLVYIKNPPADYEPGAFDLLGHLGKTREKLVADGYNGEIDFQEDLFDMTAKTRDGHFAFLPDALTKIFRFGRPFALVSYAQDPLSVPAIKTLDEVKANGDKARTVSRINGVDASAFIQDLINQASATQDLDAAKNSMFHSKSMENLGATVAFHMLGWHNYRYSGESTTIEYATGDASSAANFAVVAVPFANVTDGESFYQRTRITRIFQKTVDSFLEACRADEKSKIIVDLRMNAGGSILQGHDLFRQFFPHSEQDGFSRWRENGAFMTMAAVNSAAAGNIAPQDRDTPALVGLWHSRWNYQSGVNMTNQPFTSFDAKFGPRMWKGDPYTALMREDLANPIITASLGIGITGYGSRRNFTQPFESRDIILLTDGFCASTCSVFASGMKIQGNVKTVVMGSRPNNGLMQGVGDQEASLSQLTALPMIRSAGATLNVRDQILRSEVGTGIPAHFVNEPADCRLSWTLGMLGDVREIWEAAANSAWDGAGCIAGTGFGEARLRVQSSSKSASAAHWPEIKVISAADVGLDEGLLEDDDSDWGPEDTFMF